MEVVCIIEKVFFPLGRETGYVVKEFQCQQEKDDICVLAGERQATESPDSATPTIHSWDPLRLPSRDLMALVGSSEFKNGTRGQASREIP